MPVNSTDAFKAMELLELYRSKLSETTDRNLIEAVEKVIDVFNSQFFIALLEIQRFYTEILSNNYLSVSDKTKETLNLLNNLKMYPSSPSSVTNSGRIGRRLATDVESVNRMYSSLKRDGSLPTATGSTRTPLSTNLSDQSSIPENDFSGGMNHSIGNDAEDHDMDNMLENRPIVMEAVILRDERGFGFSVAGGIDNPYLHLNDPGIYVTKISPGGPVDINGSLNINDQILSVNGINMTYLTHETAVSTLKQAGGRLNLVIQRDPLIKSRMSALDYMRKKARLSLSESQKSDTKENGHNSISTSQVSLVPTQNQSLQNALSTTHAKTMSMPTNLNETFKTSNTSLRSRTINVSLMKGDRGLGFSIGGGRGNEHFVGDPSIYITKITEKGVAARSGVIEEGDKILQVNDYLFTNITHEDAVTILYKVGPSVQLKLYKHSQSVVTSVQEDLSEACSINNSPRKMTYGDSKINDTDSILEEMVSDCNDKSPRVVIIERPDESVSLGFNIVGGEDEDGIFVSFVNPNGIADVTENIFVGDRIWQVNGTDISVATHDEAVALLKGAGKKVELLLTTDINEYMTFESKFCNWSAKLNDDRQSLRCNSKSTPNLADNINKNIYKESFITNALSNVNKNDDHTKSVGHGLNEEILLDDSRKVDIFRTSGMYKSCKSIDVFPDDLQKSSSGSNRTDIVTDNDKENRQIVALRSNTSSTSTDRNSSLMKNGFYVRALFDFDPDTEKIVPSRPLAFLTNDIIFVVNAADSDWWQARLIEDSSDNGPIGIIPSPERLHRKERRQKRKVNFDNEIEKTGKNSKLSKNNKPSFLKRLQTSGMSKSMQNIDDNIFEKDYFDEKFDEGKVLELYYEPLIKINLDYVRPVVIIGPLREKINDMLIADHPDSFASCVPHTTRPIRPYEIDGKDYHFIMDRSQMEEEIKHQKFIEAGQYKGNLYGTSVEAVKVVASHKHCILDVSALAIKRLISSNLLPITILIKPPSVKSLCNLSNKFTIAQADSQVKKTEELQAKLSHYFTSVIWEEDFNALYRKIKSLIQSNSGSEIWVPTNQNTITF